MYYFFFLNLIFPFYTEHESWYTCSYHIANRFFGQIFHSLLICKNYNLNLDINYERNENFSYPRAIDIHEFTYDTAPHHLKFTHFILTLLGPSLIIL